LKNRLQSAMMLGDNPTNSGGWGMNIRHNGTGPYEIRESTPEEMTPERKAQWERGDRDFACLLANFREISEKCPGKYICFAGGEYFVGDTPEDAESAAASKHPGVSTGYHMRVPATRIMRV
jgi:hypothetical protein